MFILDVGSTGLVKLVLILVLGGFSSTNVDLIVAAVAKSFPPPDYKNKLIIKNWCFRGVGCWTTKLYTTISHNYIVQNDIMHL